MFALHHYIAYWVRYKRSPYATKDYDTDYSYNFFKFSAPKRLSAIASGRFFKKVSDGVKIEMKFNCRLALPLICSIIW